MTPNKTVSEKKEEACRLLQTQNRTGSPKSSSPEQENPLFFDMDALLELSKLALDPQEKDEISREMIELVGFIGQLSQLSFDTAQTLEHISPTKNVFRADLPKTCPDRAVLLQNAPEKQDGFLFVPQTVEEEEET